MVCFAVPESCSTGRMIYVDEQELGDVGTPQNDPQVGTVSDVSAPRMGYFGIFRDTEDIFFHDPFDTTPAKFSVHWTGY